MHKFKTLLTLFFLLATGVHANTKNKPFLWVYWENINGATMPGYISLCRKTLLKQCQKSFNIVELDNKNIYDYLPEIKDTEKKLNLKKLQIAQKVDYYRVLLLYKYGGLYIDSDMIVLKDLKEITDKLDHYDYVGSGHYEYNDSAETNNTTPQNWLMASRPKGLLITSLLHNMVEILQSKKQLKYHALGKYLIRNTLKPLLENGYTYYHYSNEFDGTRDKDGNFISTERIFSHEKITYKDINKLLLIAMSNWHISKMAGKKKQSEKELLAEDTNFAQFIKQSLSI